jgi:hypothetical protein
MAFLATFAPDVAVDARPAVIGILLPPGPIATAVVAAVDPNVASRASLL